MSNVKSIISNHNKCLLKKQSVTSASPVDTDCNCRKKDTCPLSGKCLTANVVYQATVTRYDSNEQQTYVGHTGCQFKTRYNDHTSSFRNPKYKHATELSKHVWNLNNNNGKYLQGATAIQTRPNDVTCVYMRNLLSFITLILPL